MDKAILKKFAIESRQELMDKIKNKISLFYVDEDFKNEQKGDIYILSNEKHSLSLTNTEFKKRELLVKRIKELSLEQVIEEAAYTWFNRIIAIRYMEINDMLPLTKDNQSLGIRVLSSKDNTPDPEILKFSNLVNSELDIDFKKEKYVELKDDNEKFKYVLLLVCKKLGKVIPQVFDGTTDYIDLLIPDNLLKDAGFIAKVINEVPESNYNQVEIIGWLYQYYNQLEKDRVISAKKNYKKSEIAYATQLFTPDWIVKYMVENSLGKFWKKHSDFDITPQNWKYYIDDETPKGEICNPNEITFIDPCCGSGHILVYAFEIFYQIYLQAGYNKNNIAELILENNLFGLDIDDRAGQLSILSILLKAREYDKNIFNKDIAKRLNVLSIQESNSISDTLINNIQLEKNRENAIYLIEKFKNAKEIGSLLLLNNNDYEELKREVENDNTIFGIELREKLLPIIKIAKILTKKYDVVVTNPPYMNKGSMSDNLKKYIFKNYANYKTDLFSAFIINNIRLTKKDCYLGFMTPYVWMFISSYEELRNYLFENVRIDSLIQLEYSAFEEAVVPICSFVLKNDKEDLLGKYIRLSDYRGGMKVQEEKYLEIINNKKENYFITDMNKMKNIPGKPISYWLSNKMFLTFNNPKVADFTFPKAGVVTGNDNFFIKLWFEINNTEICFKKRNEYGKYHLFQKGGSFRRWYGNREYVIALSNLYNDKLVNNSVRRGDKEFYFRKGIGWSQIGSNVEKSFRKIDDSVCGTATPTLYLKNDKYYNYMLALLNTKYSEILVNIFNPTLNLLTTDVGNIPFIINENNIGIIDELVEDNILIAKEDWDSFETSWDFAKHPLLKSISKVSTIRDSLANWNTYTYQQRSRLKHNEEELNKIFINIYGLNDELTPEVEDKDITIRKEDKVRDIKSFISYAVGCMFGRYSLDNDGLIYAGGDFDNVYQKYKNADGGWAGSSLSNYKYLNDNGNEIELSFEVDNDNIIPITDEAYFSDDIVERFKIFIKTVYGDNTFNENMDFIAEALGKKGTETSEETIRRYFVNDFFNDHVKMYQKRPIYWLLDSGKKNGFKALVYMHRYNENLIPKARLDYLHRVQTTYEKLLSDVNYKLTTDLSMTDKKEAKNRQTNLMAKLQEIKEYDEKIAHIANQRISIDLDDGVKVNYEKFKDILAKIK